MLYSLRSQMALNRQVRPSSPKLPMKETFYEFLTLIKAYDYGTRKWLNEKKKTNCVWSGANCLNIHQKNYKLTLIFRDIKYCNCLYQNNVQMRYVSGYIFFSFVQFRMLKKIKIKVFLGLLKRSFSKRKRKIKQRDLI